MNGEIRRGGRKGIRTDLHNVRGALEPFLLQYLYRKKTVRD
jgi:hypothetical protein